MRDEIDACKWIYLREIGEPEDNCLRLVIEEAKANDPPKDFEISPSQIIHGTKALESDPTCRAFELRWPTYVSYSVRNESFCTLDEEESWIGRLLCLYSKSKFLDYVGQATFADADYPGPVRHWGVNCLNHIVDVVSTADPQILRIEHA